MSTRNRLVPLAGAAAFGAAVMTPLHGQTPYAAATPRFDVASIKANISGDPRPQGTGTRPGGRFVATNILLSA